MAKLFALEDTQDNPEKHFEEIEEADRLDRVGEYLTSEIKDAEDSFDVTTKNIKALQNQLNLVNNIKASLESKKLASVDYFISVENLTPVMKSIADNLGVTYNIPSLEDFKNPYSTKTCHQIAMEGFVDLIKKIWEKIREFIISLIKKIQLFFKRLLNFDLELDTYERYVDKMISNIKTNKYTLTNNKAIIYSKLPLMLAKEGMDRMDTDYLLNYGLPKVDNLVEILLDMGNNLPDTIKKMTDHLDKISSENNKKILEKVNELLDAIKQAQKSYEEKNLEPVFINFQEMKLKVLKENYLDKALQELAESALLNHLTTGKYYTELHSLDSLPDKVFEKIQSSSGADIGDSNTYIYKMLNTKKAIEELPYSYNVYLVKIVDTEENDTGEDDNTKTKYLIIPYKEEVFGISNELNPLNVRDNLIELYSNYKAKYSKLNIRAIGNAISFSGNKLESTIEKNKRSATEIVDKLDKIEKILESFVLAPEVFGERSDYNLEEIKEKKRNVITKIGECNRLFNQYSIDITGLLQFIGQVTKVVGYDTVSTYVEIRYEIIKYIYNNCRLYSK